jgi:tetratricopeptide (TPR) repeat protein
VSNGKRPEPKVDLPQGWWLRLIDLSRAKWHHEEVGQTSVFDLYAITKVSRRTLSSARRTGRMTARTFSELAASLGFEDHEVFMHALRSEAERSRSRPEHSLPEDERADDEADDAIAPDFQRIIDDADVAVAESRYAEAIAKLLSLRNLVSPDSRAGIQARLDLAEIQIATDSNVPQARDEILECLRHIPRTEKKRRWSAIDLLGDAELELGNVSEAESLYREAIDLAISMGERSKEGHSLIGLSRTAELRGDLGEAESHIDKAIAVFRGHLRDADDERGQQKAALQVGAALATKAYLLTHAGRLPEALVAMESAMPLFKAAGNTDNAARGTLFKAELLLTEGKWREGFDLLQEAGKLFEEVGNTMWECRCIRHMAHLMYKLGENGAARAFMARAVHLTSTSSWEPTRCIPYLLDLAELSWEMKDKEEARALLQEAKERAIAAEPDGLVADCLLLEARIMLAPDDQDARLDLFVRATADLEQALAKCEVRGMRAVFMKRIAQLMGFRDELREARTWLERALHEFESIGDVGGMASSMLGLAAIAREDSAPDEAISTLERVLEHTKSLSLYHARAAALNDLAMLKMTHQSDLTAARRHLEEAQELAEKHCFEDVTKAVQRSTQYLGHAERLSAPTERDLSELVRELRGWCKRFPTSRDAIIPLWHYMHRSDLLTALRAAVGVKFLVHCASRDVFNAVVALEQFPGDLFVFAPTFSIERRSRIEFIPFPDDIRFPAGLVFAGVRKSDRDGEVDRESVLKAYAEILREHTYVVVGGDPSKGFRFAALGRYWRMPAHVVEMMLDSSFPPGDRVYLPVNPEGRRTNESSPDVADLKRVMQTAWENGLIPVLVDQLPDADEVNAVANTRVFLGLCGAEHRSAVRLTWKMLLRDTHKSPRDALAAFSDAWLEIDGLRDQRSGAVSAIVYALKFRAGAEEVVHPAVLLKGVSSVPE